MTEDAGHELLSAEHISAAEPVLHRIAIFTAVIGLAMVVAGLGLVWLGAQGSADINIFGPTIKTTNVGLGSIFCGLVLCLYVFKRMLKTIVDLGALK